MKKQLKFLAAFALLAALMTGCQKEQDLTITKPNAEGLVIDAEQHFKVEKAPTISKIGTVYMPDYLGNPIAHRTIKIRNTSSTFIQEWLLDDMHTDAFATTTKRSGDDSGLIYGYYYDWNELVDGQDGIGWSWNDWVYSDNALTISAIGFHIPRQSTTVGGTDGDIEKLASILGSTTLVRSKLQINYDGVSDGTPYSTTKAMIWMDVRTGYYYMNQIPGCGAMALWNQNTAGSMAIFFTNIPDLKANVRLVRDISLSQW